MSDQEITWPELIHDICKMNDEMISVRGLIINAISDIKIGYTYAGINKLQSAIKILDDKGSCLTYIDE